MKPLTRALLSITVAALALPAFASAALPKTDNPLIVPGKSIGGVSLAAGPDPAKQAWGQGRGKCSPPGIAGSCSYSRANSAFGSAFFSWAPIGSGKIERVNDIAINAGRDVDGDLKLDTKLAKFKTKKGIHLGNKGYAVAAAYPKAKFTHGDTDNFQLTTGKGSAKVTTTFQLDGQGKGRPVTGISIVRSPVCRDSRPGQGRGC